MIDMGRGNVKIRALIWDKLGHGNFNTCQIREHINDKYRYGVCSQSLCNILSQTPDFVQVGEEKVASITGSRYKVMIWARKDTEGR